MYIRFGSLVFLMMLALACSRLDVNEVTVDEGPLKYTIESDYPGEQKSDLFVFVGEKIEVVQFTPPNNEVWFDNAYDVKYRVLEHVYGEFEGNIIEFRAFDHYGYPPFAHSKHALLFVTKEDGKLYHEKYQYFDVYKTKDGKWASCGDSYRFDEYHRKPLEAVSLDLVEPVVFNLEGLTAEQIEKTYPEFFFTIEGKNAICNKGNYIDELFLVKKTGVLKARELFK